MKRVAIRRVSAKRAALMPARRAFVAEFLEANPACQIRGPDCTGRAESVHEVIKRSHQGAIVPGEKATAQGQVFMAACHVDNGYVEDHPAWARERGFTA